MPRALVLGNGQLLVTLDKHGFLRDLHYPYVGLENHASGHKHRIGVMVNGVFLATYCKSQKESII